LIGKNDYDFFPKDEADRFTTKDREISKVDNSARSRKSHPDTPSRNRLLRTKKVPLFDETGNS